MLIRSRVFMVVLCVAGGVVILAVVFRLHSNSCASVATAAYYRDYSFHQSTFLNNPFNKFPDNSFKLTNYSLELKLSSAWVTHHISGLGLSLSFPADVDDRESPDITSHFWIESSMTRT